MKQIQLLRPTFGSSVPSGCRWPRPFGIFGLDNFYASRWSRLTCPTDPEGSNGSSNQRNLGMHHMFVFLCSFGLTLVFDGIWVLAAPDLGFWSILIRFPYHDLPIRLELWRGLCNRSKGLRSNAPWKTKGVKRCEASQQPANLQLLPPAQTYGLFWHDYSPWSGVDLVVALGLWKRCALQAFAAFQLEQSVPIEAAQFYTKHLSSSTWWPPEGAVSQQQLASFILFVHIVYTCVYIRYCASTLNDYSLRSSIQTWLEAGTLCSGLSAPAHSTAKAWVRWLVSYFIQCLMLHLSWYLHLAPSCQISCFSWLWLYSMEVSWNGGTPKSSMLVGFSIMNHYKPSILGYTHRTPPYVTLFATEALEDSVAAVAMAFGRPAANPGKNTSRHWASLSIIKYR